MTEDKSKETGNHLNSDPEDLSKLSDQEKSNRFPFSQPFVQNADDLNHSLDGIHFKYDWHNEDLQFSSPTDIVSLSSINLKDTKKKKKKKKITAETIADVKDQDVTIASGISEPGKEIKPGEMEPELKEVISNDILQSSEIRKDSLIEDVISSESIEKKKAPMDTDQKNKPGKNTEEKEPDTHAEEKTKNLETLDETEDKLIEENTAVSKKLENNKSDEKPIQKSGEKKKKKQKKKKKKEKRSEFNLEKKKPSGKKEKAAKKKKKKKKKKLGHSSKSHWNSLSTQSEAELLEFTQWLNSVYPTQAEPFSKQEKKKKKKKRKKVKKKKSVIKSKIDQSIKSKEDILSENLAKLYADQGFYKKAIEMYEKLLLKNPEKSHFFAPLIEELKSKQ